jgi:succinate dehydrogenase / fumarate reductase cytochrome b subunit
MSVPQAAFVASLLAILVTILAFAVLVVATAARRTGDRTTPSSVLGRLARVPADRIEQGRWAFWAHRVSGVAIFAFLALHVVDVSLYALSAELYDEVHVLYGSAPLRVFECALLVAILFHALNGLRLLAIDLADVRPATAGRLLDIVVLATLALGVGGSAIILAPLL